MNWYRHLICLAIAAGTTPAFAQSESANYPEWIREAAEAVPETIVTACGVTRRNRPIPVLLTDRALNSDADTVRVLIVTGFDGNAESIQSALALWQSFHRGDEFTELRKHLAIGMILVANPDGATDGTGKRNAQATIPAESFPPQGTAYSDPKSPEAAYIWRWIAMFAPNLVVVERPEPTPLLRKIEDGRIKEFALSGDGDFTVVAQHPGSLIAALDAHKPCELGPWPAVETTSLRKYFDRTCESDSPDWLIPSVLIDAPPNPVALRIDGLLAVFLRKQRSPIEVATQLSKVYGHQLNSVAYIPALALIGRLRLGELTDDDSHLKDVERIARPYFDSSKPTMGKRASGSNLSGHLVFGELADRTEKERYIALAKAAADLGFDENGQPRESMPYHSEMSDAVFMGGPILVQTGRLTGESKYFDMAMRHIRFMLKLNLRKDGLHQHSPLDPANTAWGRGNGFPALGMALCLSDLPEDNRHRDEMLNIYLDHMSAMRKHQDEMGMWHQVVDHPESYREFTVTCMTTFAMTRGLRRGWLDGKTYRPVVQHAWKAIKSRIGPDGNLVDVCTGTGKQKSFRDYLDRKAILGRDDRGGAMALMVSTEIAFAEREGVLPGRNE